MEDKLFYCCHNNGVTAVVTAETMAAIEEYQQKARAIRSRDDEVETVIGLYPTPIFTFGAADQVLTHHPYLTGTYQAMNQLLIGCRVWEGGFYVPFSNGHELSGSRGAAIAELRFATPVDMVAATFGPEAMERLSRLPLPTVDLAVI